jgi:uncharacterized protein
MSQPDLQPKLKLLEENIRALGSVLVALSGGVDSSLLLKVAASVLVPSRVAAATIQSETCTEQESESAARTAAECGIVHTIIPVVDLAVPGIADNPPNRCYHCKKSHFEIIKNLAEDLGYAYVADGTNASDNSDYRPGTVAARELGIASPLRDSGITKEEIRILARCLGLPNWDAPSSPCLASRFPYGTRITAPDLIRVAQAEAFLHEAGFGECRLRHHGTLARIEIPPAMISRLSEEEIRSEVVAFLKGLGYAYVALDLEGYRTGSLNETLSSKMFNYGND